MTRLALLVTLIALPAAAQTGTCSGGGLAGSVGLALPIEKSTYSTISAVEQPFVFGAAECECNSEDIALDIFLTQTFPSASVGTAEVWVGEGCDTNNTARTTPGSTTCEKIATAVQFSQFVQGTSEAHIDIPIPALSLFSPVTHQCPSSPVSNGIYVLFFSGPQSATSGTPYAVCSLSGLTEQPKGPAAPTAVSAKASDGAVTLSWSPPDASQPQPVQYQVLCADATDAPVSASPPPASYSICENGQVQRRPLPLGGTLSLPSGSLADLDRAFVCSDALPPTSSSVRIDKLKAGAKYQFVVVGVDAYGNATASQPVAATTPAAASGGCELAPGPAGPLAPFFIFLTMALLRLGNRRRLASRRDH